MADEACKECRRLVEDGNTCPICNSNDLTTAWKGLIIVYDAENSELAEEADVTTPGRYAVRVKG